MFQLDLTTALFLLCLKLEGDQAREETKDLEIIIGKLGRDSVQGAERTKVGAIATGQWDGDVALDPVQRKARMLREASVGAGPVDNKRRDRAANDASVGARQLQLITGLESEPSFIQDSAGGP